MVFQMAKPTAHMRSVADEERMDKGTDIPPSMTAPTPGCHGPTLLSHCSIAPAPAAAVFVFPDPQQWLLHPSTKQHPLPATFYPRKAPVEEHAAQKGACPAPNTPHPPPAAAIPLGDTEVVPPPGNPARG